MCVYIYIITIDSETGFSKTIDIYRSTGDRLCAPHAVGILLLPKWLNTNIWSGWVAKSVCLPYEVHSGGSLSVRCFRLTFFIDGIWPSPCFHVQVIWKKYGTLSSVDRIQSIWPTPYFFHFSTLTQWYTPTLILVSALSNVYTNQTNGSPTRITFITIILLLCVFSSFVR